MRSWLSLFYPVTKLYKRVIIGLERMLRTDLLFLREFLGRQYLYFLSILVILSYI